MTTAYQRPLYGYRFAEIRHGDTLQAIAARELGDASLWTDLITYNELRPPFITDDPAMAGHGVLLSGALIRLPAPAPTVSSVTSADEVFGVDIMLSGGQLTTKDGDLGLASGNDNLHQALKHRIDTDRGELLFHQEYGSLVRSLVGTVNGPTAALLAGEYAKSAVLADDRIQQVTKTTAEVIGETINISVEAQPIVGKVISMNVTT